MLPSRRSQVDVVPQSSRSLPRRMQASQMRLHSQQQLYQQQQQQQYQQQQQQQYLQQQQLQQLQQQQQRVRLPRSADPSPQRTARRLESLNELHGGPLSIPFPPTQMGQFPPPEVLYHDVSQHKEGNFPLVSGQAPHHHHQVLNEHKLKRWEFNLHFSLLLSGLIALLCCVLNIKVDQNE
jgi:hypothetical protein